MKCFKYLRAEQMMEERLIGKNYEEGVYVLHHKKKVQNLNEQAESYSGQSL